MPIMQLLFGFEGRIRRTTWWLTRLGVAFGSFIVLFLLGGILAASGSRDNALDGHQAPAAAAIIVGLLVVILAPIAIWADLALSVKRAHDRDRSGWFALVALIPIIDGLWLLIELGFLDGTPGPNRYGPSPKGLGGPVGPISDTFR